MGPGKLVMLHTLRCIVFFDLEDRLEHERANKNSFSKRKALETTHSHHGRIMLSNSNLAYLILLVEDETALLTGFKTSFSAVYDVGCTI
jgi:hypothetical protein